MNSSGQIDKLIEKCRKGDDKACQEVRDYRKFLEERFRVVEGVFLTSILAITVSIITGQFLETYVKIVEVPMIHKIILIVIACTLFVIVSQMYVSIGKFIKKLYEVFTDPEMPHMKQIYIAITGGSIILAMFILWILM